MLGWARISCLHHHTQQMPIVQVQLHYADRLHDLNLVRSDDLPWPLLLGQDAPDFALVLQQATVEDGVWAAGNDPDEETTSGTGGTAHHRLYPNPSPPGYRTLPSARRRRTIPPYNVCGRALLWMTDR